MELNQNSIESDLLRIKREQETTIKNQLDYMKAQLSACEDSLRTLKIELDQRITMQLLKESNKRLEEGIQSSLAQKIRDSMKKYEPIIEGFEDFKRFKHSFLEHEDRYLEFQTKTQTKIVAFFYPDHPRKRPARTQERSPASHRAEDRAAAHPPNRRERIRRHEVQREAAEE